MDGEEWILRLKPDERPTEAFGDDTFLFYVFPAGIAGIQYSWMEKNGSSV